MACDLTFEVFAQWYCPSLVFVIGPHDAGPGDDVQVPAGTGWREQYRIAGCR